MAPVLRDACQAEADLRDDGRLPTSALELIDEIPGLPNLFAGSRFFRSSQVTAERSHAMVHFEERRRMMVYSLRGVGTCGLMLAFLAGCTAAGQSLRPETQPLLTTSARTIGEPLAALHVSSVQPKEGAKTSWIEPSARNQDLLYVSDFSNNVVDVYTYPKGQLVGTLTGFEGPEGACVDAHGNVWISSQGQGKIFEYAHGGSSPLATLTLGDQLIDGCSVDTSTGTLAVDSLCQTQDFVCVAAGSVFIYKNIKKPPHQFSDSNIELFYFCGYDSAGNLFIDGNQTSIGPFEFAELPHGSTTFTNITLNRIIYYPGGVQWDGKYIAVGDQEAGNEATSSVHQIAVTGSAGNVVSTTKLEGTDDVVQFWIQGKRIIAPDIGKNESDVRLFKYPDGGAPIRIITGFSEAIGAVVSLAKHKASVSRGSVTP